MKSVFTDAPFQTTKRYANMYRKSIHEYKEVESYSTQKLIKGK